MKFFRLDDLEMTLFRLFGETFLFDEIYFYCDQNEDTIKREMGTFGLMTKVKPKTILIFFSFLNSGMKYLKSWCKKLPAKYNFSEGLH